MANRIQLRELPLALQLRNAVAPFARITTPVKDPYHEEVIASHRSGDREVSVSTLATGVGHSLPSITEELTEGHFLKSFIVQEGPITNADVKGILDKLPRLSLAYYENGGMPGSTNKVSPYQDGSWRRDDAIMLYSLINAASFPFLDRESKLELEKIIKQKLTQFACFDNDPSQREHYTSFFFLDSQDANRNRELAKQKFRKDIQGLPRAKASINSEGYLGDYVDWGHDQLDSFGLMLYVYFYAANQGIIDLKELDSHLTNIEKERQSPGERQRGEKTNNEKDSIFSVMINFLLTVEYHSQDDRGAWEKEQAYQRTSSVGLCQLAMLEAKTYFENRKWDPNKIIRINENVDLKAKMKEGIHHGDGVLNMRIPSDGRNAVETDKTPNDAALAFLLLFNPNLTEEQEKAIEKALEDLDDRRFKGDNFMGQNYALNPKGKGEWADPVEGFEEARWTIFRPMRAAYYYKKYIKSVEKGLPDEESFEKANHHFKKTLPLITKQKYVFEQHVNQYEKVTVEVDAGVLPEAWWKLAQGNDERWLPNSNSPLNMASAIFGVMITEAIKANNLRESMSGSILAA